MNKPVLADLVVYAGPHPWQDAGWQIALKVGAVDVSIAWTPYTQGVELMAWGLFTKPLEHVTPAQALDVLNYLLQRKEGER
jgi:hypothetical protein